MRERKRETERENEREKERELVPLRFPSSESRIWNAYQRLLRASCGVNLKS